MESDFEIYLADKKIDSQAFGDAQPEKWQSFKLLFDQVHPASFTVQKKFLLNDLRRLYPAKATEPILPETKAEEPKKAAKPVVRRAPVIKKPEAGSEQTDDERRIP
jgi:hypothetical protein